MWESWVRYMSRSEKVEASQTSGCVGGKIVMGTGGTREPVCGREVDRKCIMWNEDRRE
jgi:hypothetical protein